MPSRSRPRLVTIKEAAEAIGLTESEYRSAVRKGSLPGYVPGFKKVDIESVHRWLDDKMRIEPKSDAAEVSEDKWLAYFKRWEASRENRRQARPRC